MAAKKDLPTKKTMEYIKKNLKTKPGMKVTKKADPMKASAKSHQGSLAQVAGATANANEYNRQKKKGAAEWKKTGKTYKLDAQKMTTADNKAVRRTLKSFK